MCDSNIQQFADAALADGWHRDAASKEHLLILTKDGFTMHIYYNVSMVMIWGPDTLFVKVPIKYNYQEILNNLKKCTYCDREDVPTYRVGFAGRCCEECLPRMKKELEYNGRYN